MKSKIVKSIIDIIIVFLIFGIGQVLAGVMIGVFVRSLPPEIKPTLMGGALVAGSLFTIVFLMAIRYFATAIQWLERVDFIAEFNPKRIRWKYALMLVIATLAGVFFANLVVFLCGVKNTLEGVFQQLGTNPLGILGIAILGPICEELVFRHSITGGMLRRGVKPWVAIVLPAVLFGIAHMNPAQSFFAAWLGLMFGILYYKSQSIIPSTLLHILNNSLSVAIMNIDDGNLDKAALESLSGTDTILLYVFMFMCFVTCVLSYLYYMKQPRCPLPEKPSEVNIQNTGDYEPLQN